MDSLEHAVSLGLLEQQGMRIDIVVNAEDSYISIRDNGTGISADEVAKTLMNVGSSKKEIQAIVTSVESGVWAA